MTIFPTDDATLLLLIAACRINPDTGRSHVHDFLQMGVIEKSREDITDEFGDGDGMFGGAPVYYVEYEKGREPFGVNDALVALAEEVLRIRADVGPNAAKEDS